MEFLIYFLVTLSGTYLSLKPLMSILFLLLTIFFLRKCHFKRVLIVSAILFVVSFLGVFLTRFSIFNSSCIGIVTSSKENYVIVHSALSFYYIKAPNHSYEVLDIIKIEGTTSPIKFSSLESSFDFENYLHENLVNLEINATNITSIFKTPFRIKNIISNNLSFYDDITSNIIGKLLFNVSSSDNYNDLISKNSLFYLLAISSLHVHFLNMIVYKLLNAKLKDKICDIIIIIFTLIIFMFSNYKMSIFKLVLYYLINYINSYKLKNKLDYISKISLLGVVIILISPKYAFSKGFIYSFSLPYYLFYGRTIVNMFNKSVQKYIRILLVFLFITPINIYQNYTVSLFSFPFTILLSPIILIIYLLGVIGLILPIYPIINYLAKYLYKVLFIFNKINIVFNVGEVSVLFLIIYYLLLFHLLLSFESKWLQMKIKLSGAMISLIIISSLPLTNLVTTEVSFINVGQGDSILIRDGNTNVLVDTGGSKSIDIATSSLIPYFRKKKINHLDYVFITHNDFDHNGALTSLQENFKVKDTNLDNNFYQKRINNLTFTNLNKTNKNEDNSDSLVLYFELNNKYYLLMGDADIKIEEKIMLTYDALKVDYLKVGHHGSRTSTSDKFISYLKPKEAIISCSYNNYYGHPHSEVVATLNKYNVKIRRTDLEGTISYKAIKKFQ